MYDEEQLQVDDESFHVPHVPGCVWVEELSAQRAEVVGVLPDVIQRHTGGNTLRWVEPPMDAARLLRSARVPPDGGRAVAWAVEFGLAWRVRVSGAERQGGLRRKQAHKVP